MDPVYRVNYRVHPVFTRYTESITGSSLKFPVSHFCKIIYFGLLVLSMYTYPCCSPMLYFSHVKILGMQNSCLISFPRNLCGSRCLPCLFENVFDSYQVYLDGRQTFSSWYFVPLWKVYRVWFICLNLALFGSALSHSFLHVLFAWMR